jgi:hypothetical protein
MYPVPPNRGCPFTSPASMRHDTMYIREIGMIAADHRDLIVLSCSVRDGPLVRVHWLCGAL